MANEELLQALLMISLYFLSPLPSGFWMDGGVGISITLQLKEKLSSSLS